MLIRNQADVAATKLKIAFISEDDDQLPDIADAEARYLLPFIGQTLLDALDAVKTALDYSGPIDNAPDAPDADLVAILPMVQKPLAAFAYWADLPAIHSRITSSGVRRTTTDGMPTAYRWEYDEARSYLEERAYSTLETMLQYLYDNAVTYADYIEEDLQTRRAICLFKSGKDFTTYYRLHQPFRTYMHLKALADEVIKQYIIPGIGEQFYNELTSEAAPDDQDKYLLDKLKSATANLTISKAVQKLPFRISPAGFTIANTTAAAAVAAGEVSKSGPDTGIVQRFSERDGEQALRAAMKYLQTHASPTKWLTFYASDLHKGPDAYKPTTGNDTRKIFRM